LLASQVLQLEQEARESVAAARARVKRRVIVKKEDGCSMKSDKKKGLGVNPGPKILFVGAAAHINHRRRRSLGLGRAGGETTGENDSGEEEEGCFHFD